MVPSAKTLAAPAPSAPTDPAVDHFQCYKVKRAKGFPKFTKIVGVDVKDQFGTGVISLVKPSDLCAPVNKRGEEPGAETHPFHLMCYKAKGNAPFGTKQVWLGDQFGSLNGVRLSHRPRLLRAVDQEPELHHHDEHHDVDHDQHDDHHLDDHHDHDGREPERRVPGGFARSAKLTARPTFPSRHQAPAERRLRRGRLLLRGRPTGSRASSSCGSSASSTWSRSCVLAQQLLPLLGSHGLLPIPLFLERRRRRARVARRRVPARPEPVLARRLGRRSSRPCAWLGVALSVPVLLGFANGVLLAGALGRSTCPSSTSDRSGTASAGRSSCSRPASSPSSSARRSTPRPFPRRPPPTAGHLAAALARPSASCSARA